MHQTTGSWSGFVNQKMNVTATGLDRNLIDWNDSIIFQHRMRLWCGYSHLCCFDFTAGSRLKCLRSKLKWHCWQPQVDREIIGAQSSCGNHERVDWLKCITCQVKKWVNKVRVSAKKDWIAWYQHMNLSPKVWNCQKWIQLFWAVLHADLQSATRNHALCSTYLKWSQQWNWSWTVL